MPCAPQENIYRQVNSILYHRRSSQLTKWKHFIWHLVTAVRSLPKYPPGEMLYRGIDGKFFKQEDYSKGSHVVWHSFTSCSKSESQAKSFMKVSSFFDWKAIKPQINKDPKTGVFFFIQATEGRIIGRLTPFPQEEEVLFEPDSEFTVSGSVRLGDYWVVNMEQVPTTNLVVPSTSLECTSLQCLLLCCIYSVRL